MGDISPGIGPIFRPVACGWCSGFFSQNVPPAKTPIPTTISFPRIVMSMSMTRHLIGGDKYPLLTLLSGPISRLKNHTVKHKSSTLRPALELRLHGFCIICKTHVTHKISTARLSSRKVLCV